MRAQLRHDLARGGLVAALAALAVVEELLLPTVDVAVPIRITLALAATLPVGLRFGRPPGAAAATAAVVAFGAAVALAIVVGHAPWGVVAAQILLGWAVAQSAPGPVVAGSAVVCAVIAALGTSATSTSGPASVTGSPDGSVLPTTDEVSGFFLPEMHPASLVLGLAVLLSLGTSWTVRARRDRADRAEAERERAEAELLHSARGERARIARELHDVVAHHLSMISVQAETARLTTPELHPEGEQRLKDIGDIARTALTEMRRLLGVLRDDDGLHDSEGPNARVPQPGLDQIGELVEAADTGAGTPASLVVRGTPVPLDPGTQLTAYRIVQEGLTNVRRHAPGSTAEVLVAYDERGLRIRVSDNGPGAAASGLAAGHGIRGLRERVVMVGGELRLGDGPNGGFVLDALLPTTLRDSGIRR
ncbi:histidine kinase [Knoellia sp. S7-12]|uniref:sensor histidine kinase n=1 Tax=Knoellia sp. S7-12 TaxID=3126698 RepID=UPI003367AC99